jgi:hypothetical protein
MFDAFWQATGELPFDALTATCAECYRLSIETSLAPQHRVYRMQRSLDRTTCFVAYFFVFGADRRVATAAAHEMAREEPLWRALDVLLAVAQFWEMPAESDRGGLDGSTYTLEAWKSGCAHRVVRWSPNPIVSGASCLL